jgi:GDP-4-dehydro-6-deoxy-D-mannose reductase
MRVLITGITGMIGTHLAELLISQGQEVAGLSRATSSSRYNNPGRKYKHFAGDIQDVGFIRRVWGDFKPELVYHLAAQAYNGISWEAEDTTYSMNVGGSRNVLHACREFTPQARVIPACSSAEYGLIDEDMIPIREDVTLLRPMTPYGVSKAAMEMMARQFCLNFGTDVVLPRLFIHVGPNHPPVTALQNFARQLAAIKLGKQPPTMKVGNLTTARDFVDVRDGAAALWTLAQKGTKGEAYNICTGKAWNIGQSLEMLIEVSGLKVEVQQDKSLLRASDEPLLLGNNDKLSALGWQPKTPFRQTLEDIYKNWLERLK